jgi:hypothetical protein
MSSDLFGDPSLSFAFPELTHQHPSPASMLLPLSSEANTMSIPKPQGTASSNAGDVSCRCMTDALAILDKLEIRKTELSPCVTHSVSGTLSTNKSALLRCNKVIECTSCQCRPGCALLLILICRNLVLQFQELLFRELNTHDRQSPPTGPLDNSTTALGQYLIDTSEEQLQVLYALAIVQGRSLALFLKKLKSLVCFQSGATSHGQKIESMESWHCSLMGRLKQMCYERI